MTIDNPYGLHLTCNLILSESKQKRGDMFIPILTLIRCQILREFLLRFF